MLSKEKGIIRIAERDIGNYEEIEILTCSQKDYFLKSGDLPIILRKKTDFGFILKLKVWQKHFYNLHKKVGYQVKKSSSIKIKVFLRKFFELIF